MTKELADLIARLEAAPEPTRELFEAAYVACFGPVECDEDRTNNVAYKNWVRFCRFQTFCVAEAWTDAAMMLVPENCDWELSKEHAINGDLIYRCEAGSSPCIKAATPALALVIAALKAQAADLGD